MAGLSSVYRKFLDGITSAVADRLMIGFNSSDGTPDVPKIDDYSKALFTRNVGGTPGVGGIDGDNKVFEDSSFVVGDSPKTIDLNAALGYNATAGYVACDGVGDILVKLSRNGTAFGEQFAMKSGDILPIDGLKLDTIVITHSGVNSSYRINAW